MNFSPVSTASLYMNQKVSFEINKSIYVGKFTKIDFKFVTLIEVKSKQSGLVWIKNKI